MPSVEDALSALCQCINPLANVTLTAEHLSLTKYNAVDKNVAEMLWNALHIFSYHAAREKRNDIDFRNYDTLSAVKLHFAFLQYPAVEFYNLPRENNQNRVPMIALSWLLATQDVLTITLRTKLVNSVLGAEYSHIDPPESASSNIKHNNQLLSTDAQFNNILHLNDKVNKNLKEISELICERANLTSKVHAASMEYFGHQSALGPLENSQHLSVSELALMKRLVTLDESSVEDRRQLREIRDVRHLLDAYMKWLDNRHVFFDWMASVIQEHKRYMELNVNRISWRELAAFISLLCHITNSKLQVLRESGVTASDSQNFVLDCPSRTQKSQRDNNEAQKWLEDLNERQEIEKLRLQKNRKRLAAELKEMLQLIPSSIHVQR